MSASSSNTGQNALNQQYYGIQPLSSVIVTSTSSSPSRTSSSLSISTNTTNTTTSPSNVSSTRRRISSHYNNTPPVHGKKQNQNRDSQQQQHEQQADTSAGMQQLPPSQLHCQYSLPLIQHTIATYPLPENLFYGRNPNTENNNHNNNHNNNPSSYSSPHEGDGIPILKMNKAGVLQPRHLSFSRDRRHLFITTKKMKHNMKTMFQKMKIVSTTTTAAAALLLTKKNKMRGSSQNQDKKKKNHDNNNNTNSETTTTTTDDQNHNIMNKQQQTSSSSSSITTSTTTSLNHPFPSSSSHKVIPIQLIDHIEKGPVSMKFIQLERTALYGDTNAMEMVQKYMYGKKSYHDGYHDHQNNNKNNKQQSSSSPSPSSSLQSSTLGSNQQHQQQHQNNSNNNDLELCCCFSIVYRTTLTDLSSNTTDHVPSPLETVDIILVNPNDYHIVCDAVEQLKYWLQVESCHYTIPLQMIRYHVMDMNGMDVGPIYGWNRNNSNRRNSMNSSNMNTTPSRRHPSETSTTSTDLFFNTSTTTAPAIVVTTTTTLGLSDFIQLTERIQLSIPKSILTRYFKDECKKQKRSQRNKLQPTTNTTGTTSSSGNGSGHHNNNGNLTYQQHSSYYNYGGSCSSSSNSSSNSDRLPIPEITVLIERLKTFIVSNEMDPLQILWNHLVETDPVPAVGFVRNTSTTTTTTTTTPTSSTPPSGTKSKTTTKVGGTRSSSGESPKDGIPIHRNGSSFSKSRKHQNKSYDDDDEDEEEEDDISLELSLFDLQDQSISAVAFLSFLRSEQKCYHMTLEEAIQYIHELNNIRTPEQCCLGGSNKNGQQLFMYGGASQNNIAIVNDGTTNNEEGDSDFVDDTIPLAQQELAQEQQQNRTLIGEQDRLLKHSFISWLLSDLNDIVDPNRSLVGADDMTYPLTHYWINTSHDTYLQPFPNENIQFGGRTPVSTPLIGNSGSTSGYNGSNNNNNSNTSISRLKLSFHLKASPSSASDSSSPVNYRHNHHQNNNKNDKNKMKIMMNNKGPYLVDAYMYLAALYRGVRCLELDVWPDERINEPVIARWSPNVSDSMSTTTFMTTAGSGSGGNSATNQTAVPLRIVLRLIQYFVQNHPNTFPVILKIENHVTNRYPLIQQQIPKYLHEYLGRHHLIVMSPDGCMFLDRSMVLPTPLAGKGKVIIIGKRPKQITTVMNVYNDDFDDDVFYQKIKMNHNDQHEDTTGNFMGGLKGSNSDASTAETTFPDDNNTNNNTSDTDDDLDTHLSELEQSGHVVIGFDTKGPIYSTAVDGNTNYLVRTPSELLAIAFDDSRRAITERDEEIRREQTLLKDVYKYELLTAEYTQISGLSPLEVKRRAARAANRKERDEYEDYIEGEEEYLNRDYDTDDNNIQHSSDTGVGIATSGDGSGNDRGIPNHGSNFTKDEGIEVHEVLPTFVERAQDSYAQAAQDAMEAAMKQTSFLVKLKEAQRELERAQNDLEMSKQLEHNCIVNAKKAAGEARAHVTDARTARERVEQVRELVRTSQDQSSSAGTVVQTAVTEAKISEKRAQEAELRAQRAMNAAVKDRNKADMETKREEELEKEVTILHSQCQEISEAVTKARERLTKANNMNEKINEQMKLIERSTQYKQEKDMERQQSGEQTYVRHGGSFIAKYEVKFEERLACRALMKEANEDKIGKEEQLKNLKQLFEERAYQWRKQADHAAQMRRSADRSMMVAEEFKEHAEEERDAAQLRRIAREKALSVVEDRSHLNKSVEEQLAQAERAAQEATDLAETSRKRADRLAMEAEKLNDHTHFVEAVSKRAVLVEQAKGEYDTVVLERKETDRVAKEQKRRLDSNSLVYRSTARSAATEHNRTMNVQRQQQEAIVAYNRTLLLRKDADSAKTKVEIAISIAEAKNIAFKHATKYKEKMDSRIELPIMLAKMTLFHTTKFHVNSWNKSLSLSNAHVHSIPQNVLVQMMCSEGNSTANNSNGATHDQDHHPNHQHHPQQQSLYIRCFTKNHLCRVYPAWKPLLLSASTSLNNYANNSPPVLWNADPVLAWSMGCQLVAMNYQTMDESLLIGDGRFRQNGSSGYVLKPKHLIVSTADAELQQQQQQQQQNQQRHHNIPMNVKEETWSFCVLGGYHLPRVHTSGTRSGTSARSIYKPIVKISLYEGSTTETRIMYKTQPSITTRNGYHIIWDPNDVFYFHIKNPTIAMLSFTVWDTTITDSSEGKGDNRQTQQQQQHQQLGVSGNVSDEVFVAGAAFPISCIQEGYRSIALYDIHHTKMGSYKYSSIFVKVTCNRKRS